MKSRGNKKMMVKIDKIQFNPTEAAKKVVLGCICHYIKLNVSDIDVENIHDHVTFYDGNNTSSEFLLEHLTGTHQALTLSSNDNMMTIKFYSDSSHGRRGYHFVAFAVPKSTFKPTQVLIPTMEESNSGKYGKPTQIMDELPSKDSLVDSFWLIDSENFRNRQPAKFRESERTDERSYLADVGQGFLIKWDESCYSNTDAPHYIFNREILDPYYCGPHLRYIGNEVVTVQKEKRAKSQFYCRYHMVPLNSNITSETIYVISGTSNTFDVFDGNNERYKITGQIVSRDYWKYVDFEKQYSGTYWQGADLEYIYAITTKRYCACSLFKQKKYDKQEHKIKIKIPAHCELIFCDWTIASGGKKEMTVKIDNGKENDEVHIWNQNSMEKYNSTQLKQPRKLYLTTCSDTHVSFRRNTSGVLQQNFPSLVTVSWITASDTMCYKQSNVSLTTTPQAFISPNYPLPYNFFGTCQTLLVAPDNHYIKLNVSDFDVENIHDHVSFYDGNNTSSEFLLEQLTGTHQALTLSSSCNMMTVNFFSDGSHGRRGYHFIAFAVANPTPKSTEVAMPTMEETSSNKLGKLTQIMDHLQSNDSFVDPFWLIESENATTSGTDNLQNSGSKHGFFFYLFYTFCVVFITIGTLFGGFALYKNLYPKKPETSFANEMVRFRNDDTGSVVTIEN
ncbi:hypothetical protein L3Y34_011075 [Caenorhabditis briggsae]|uniref:CUB domain-containing protein n=1 Tax=Caenorhabditis briggsae TaxID=6238 RepID=A0AAE8ZRZ2_CAEBR|nr:hypothetical protein L3Y34_011075 [Caenorhabditis briggsae]